MGNTEGNAGHQSGGWRARVVLLAIALAGAVTASAQTVSENFDRISGERTIAYTADGSRDPKGPVFTFNASIDAGTPSAAVSLAFVSAGEGPGALAPRFAACHDIHWLVDGRPLMAGSASHRGRIVDGEMIELINQDVTPSWAAAISTARDVRYRVCREEYAFSLSDIDAFGMIAAKLKSTGLASSGSRASAPAPAPVQEVQYQGMSWRPTHQDLMLPAKR